jgi:hypothetical protein
LKNIQKIIDNFTKGKLNVAANRICLPVEGGGLGMFNLEDFLASQQATWIFRCRISCRDNWRGDVLELTNGNPFVINSNNIDPIRHPVISCLAASFNRLRVSYDRCNENYLHGYILNHPIFFRNQGNKLPLTVDFLGITDIEQKIIISNLTLQECYGMNGLHQYGTFVQLTNLNITLHHYRLLKASLDHFMRRINVDRYSDGSATSMYDALCTILKPSVKGRRFLSKYRNKSFTLGTLTTTKTFFRLIGADYNDNLNFSINVSLWNLSNMSNRLRTFSFKFFNNILGLNTRTSHFAAQPNRGCFFVPIRVFYRYLMNHFHICSGIAQPRSAGTGHLLMNSFTLNSSTLKKKTIFGFLEDSLPSLLKLIWYSSWDP